MQLVTRLLSRMLIVGSVVMAIALAATLWAARQNMADEIDSSERIGRLLAALAELQRDLPPSQQAAAIDALNADGSLRYFHVRLLDEGGNTLTRPQQDPGLPNALASWLLREPTPPAYRLPLQRPDGQRLTMVLEPRPQAESAEAMAGALLQLALFGAIALALIVALWFSVRRALAPLSGILSGIARIERGDYAVPIPRSETRELDQISQALNHLAGALTVEQARRRELLHRLQDVQEDERRRLAHELHDEFGQLLTALQVDASYLLKQSAGQPALEECAQAVVENSSSILAQLRGLLAQLRPYGLQGGEDRQIALAQALRDLVRQRRARPDAQLDCGLSVDLADAQLPARLAVAVYRIAQEALTNVMRHSGATRVDLALVVDRVGHELVLTVSDNGRGLPADPGADRGIGLAGIRERVLANEGVLELNPARPQGLQLIARFPLALPTGGDEPAMPDERSLQA